MTEDFRNTSEWYRKMKADGFTVPLTLYYTLEKMVKEKRTTFQTAYNDLLSKDRIKIVNKVIIFDLNEK